MLNKGQQLHIFLLRCRGVPRNWFKPYRAGNGAIGYYNAVPVHSEFGVTKLSFLICIKKVTLWLT